MKTLVGLILFFGCLILSCGSTENESIPPETAPFGASGGEYVYSNGLTLIIPPGALAHQTNISLRDLNPDETNALLDIRGISPDNLLFAFEAGPDGLTFQTPVKVVIPVDHLTADMLPLITEFHLGDYRASVADARYIADVDQGMIELWISHFSGAAGEIIDEIKRNECEDGSNTACRCGRIEVTQDDLDHSCSDGNCQVLYSENRVKFLDCPGAPEESSIFEESSPGCAPKMTMTAGQIYLNKGEQTTISSLIELGCAGMSDKTVSFSVSGVGTISPSSDRTDSQGKASTTVSAGDEFGKITISAEATVTYYTKRISVNGVDLVSEQETATLTKSIDVYVIEKPTLTLTSGDEVIDFDDVTYITATLLQDEEPLEGQLVNLSVTGPAEIMPSSGRTASDGTTFSLLSSNQTEGTAVVTANSNVTITLPGGEEKLFPLSASVSVAIVEEPDYEGSVWRFVYTTDITINYKPWGCDNYNYGPPCSCDGDYTGVTYQEKISQTISGQFSISRPNYYSYAVTVSNVSGTVQVNRPASQFYSTCPLDGGFGSPGCSCDYQGHTRTDGDGYLAVNDSRTFNWPQPSEDQFESYLSYDGSYFFLNVYPPMLSYQDLIQEVTWQSTSSTCACLSWDGTRDYDSSGHWGFLDAWSDDFILRNRTWTVTDTRGDWIETNTYSIECISNCDF